MILKANGRAAHCIMAVMWLCVPLVSHAEADLVLHNGKIVTVDDQFSTAQAIAIKGERIVAVGARKPNGSTLRAARLSPD